MKTSAMIFLSLSLVALGCGKKEDPKAPVALMSTDSSAAAQGQVMVNDAGNGNAELVVEIKHVPKADKAAPGATTYVVWAKPSGGEPMNLGAISVNDELNGSLRTVTPMKHFDIFITAEPSAQAMRPSATPVLSARVERE
jgi:hypothetical protein